MSDVSASSCVKAKPSSVSFFNFVLNQLSTFSSTPTISLFPQLFRLKCSQSVSFLATERIHFFANDAGDFIEHTQDRVASIAYTPAISL
jgi:hypothetical protein